MPFQSMSETVATAVVHRLGWTEFRPAQPPILEAMASQENLLVMGPSGSGKSTAAVLGIVDALLKSPSRGVSVLYLTNDEATTAWMVELCQACDLLAGAAEEFSRGEIPDLLFVSPAGLEPQLSRGHDWSALRLVVTDDLSSVLSESSGAHLNAVLERLFALAGSDPQRVGLSATVGDSEIALAWLCGGSQRTARVVRVPGAGGRRLLEVEGIGPGMDPAEIVAVKVRGRGALVQVDSTEALQLLHSGLERRGLRCQGETRDCQLSLGAPSSTDLAYKQVISLEPPGSVRDLLRTMALTGSAAFKAQPLRPRPLRYRDPRSVSRVCLASTNDEDFLAACAAVLLAGQRWVEPASPQRAAWPVYLQQLIGRILASNGITREEALQDRGRPWAFGELSREERQQVLDHLLDHDILQNAAGRLVLGGRGEAEFDNALWRQTGRPFWRPERYVTQTQDNPHTGSVDAWFLQAVPSLRYAQGERLWQLDEIRSRAGTAKIREAQGGGGICWLGALRVYHPRFCAEIRNLLLSDESPGFLQTRQLRALERLRDRWRPLLARSGPGQLLTFAGAKVNGVIAKLHHHQTGEKVAFSNLVVEVAGGDAALRPTLERLRDGLSSEDEQRLVGDCRHDKLLDYLPAEIRTSYLVRQLFDLDGARGVADGALETARVAGMAALAESTLLGKGALEIVASEVPAVAGAAAATELPVVTEAAISEPEVAAVKGDPFFAQLIQLARSETTRNKWVFLPEESLKWVLSERLLQAGVDWVNFRFHTPFEIARDLAAPYLVQAGIRPKPEELGPEVMTKLLLQIPNQGDGYFRPLADQGGIAQPIWRAISALRMAGLSSEDLALDMFTRQAKGREIKALLGAYERYLVEHQVGDRATVYRAALERLSNAPVGSGDLVLEYPDGPWSALDRRFLDGLGGVATPAWVSQGEEPRRWPLLCAPRELRQRVVDKDSHLLAMLSSGLRPAAKNDGTLQFFCAGRRDAEIQEVLRRILQRATPLDQVEIAVHDADSLALVWDKLQKHELPATFQDGLPLSATTPGRAVLGLLRWSEANFACFYLRELLLAGLLQVKDGSTTGAFGVSSTAAARHLAQAKITWGRDSYAPAIAKREARYRAASQAKEIGPEQAEYQTRQADGVAEFGLWVQRLLGNMPPIDADGGMRLEALIDGLLSTLDQDVPLGGRLDQAATTSISRALRDLKMLADAPWSSQQCHRLVREKLESLTVGTGRPEAGKISVTSPTKMGRAGRPHMYVLGLEAGSLLPDTAEDAVLSDRERTQLHASLELSTDRVLEKRFQLWQRLGSLDGEVTLSYSCRDYRTGEELLPSRLFFDAARLLYPGVKDYDQLGEALGEPLGLAPPLAEHAAGDAEWWLAKLGGCGKDAEPTVLAGFPWLWRGQQAQAQRESSLFTPFDGWVPQAANIYDPRVSAVPISVSRLQDLAACPYRTFLKTVLAVQPLELEPPNLDRWLSAAAQGTALHETFAAYYRGVRASASAPAPGDLATLVTLLRAELEKIRDLLPPPSAAIESAETERLHRDLEHFLRLEVKEQREVIACEVGFGMAHTYDEPLATVAPVVIDLGDDLRFPMRGQIDRIDRVSGGYEVVDYKTGSKLTDAAKPRYVQGQLLQHALYALIAQSLLKSQNGQVLKSSYYFPGVRAKQSWMRFPYPETAALTEVLTLVLEPLRTGAFAHTVESDKQCRYCDFRAACVAQSDQGMLAKYDNPENPMLEGRRRLRSIP